MGFRYRKSINIGGGFRVNISKSGIGYSWGTKGYRISKTSNGNIRKTSTLPGTGLSYVEELSNKNKKGRINSNDFLNNNLQVNTYDSQEIKNVLTSDISSDNLKDIVSLANRSIKLNKITNLFLGSSFVLSFINTNFLIMTIISLILKVYIKTKGTVELEYSIDEDQKSVVSEKIKPFLRISDSSNIWRITETSKVIDTKYTAGAKNVIKRQKCKVSKKIPFPFKVNVSATSYIYNKERLFFLPDKLFFIQKNKVFAINYTDVKTCIYNQNFIENVSVPKDATIVGYTWEFVNKNGGPDKRFKKNRQLPICSYGSLSISSPYGLNTILMFSKGLSRLD